MDLVNADLAILAILTHSCCLFLLVMGVSGHGWQRVSLQLHSVAVTVVESLVH